MLLFQKLIFNIPKKVVNVLQKINISKKVVFQKFQKLSNKV